MKKHTGFTLAEVLITLGIIGVIVAFGIVVLFYTTQKAEHKSAFKKFISTMNQALTNLATVEYINFGEVEEGGLDATQSIASVLNKNMFISKVISGSDRETEKMFGDTSSNYTIFFADGSVLSYPQTAARCTDYLNPTTKNDCAGIVDINGLYSPNRLSNCKWEASMGKTSTESSDNTVGGGLSSCVEDNVFISDQYSVRFIGEKLVPNGHAARYVLYEK